MIETARTASRPPRSKGQATRDAIVATAVREAYANGINSLTFGTLATQLGLSKSGLYAHFGSKEGLQIAVLDAAAADFTDLVIRPALQAPRGRERVWELVERWWAVKFAHTPGPLLLVRAIGEMERNPGPINSRVSKAHQDMHKVIERICESAKLHGHFKPDTDAKQFAFDIYGIMLSSYLSWQVLGDDHTPEHLDTAVENLLERVQL